MFTKKRQTEQTEETEAIRPSIRTVAGYLKAAFVNDNEFARYVAYAEIQLKSVDYDTMIGMGLSGALVVPRLARALGKKWAIVRKEDGAHSKNKIEGEIGNKWIFVDDQVDSGRTRRIAQERVESHVERQNSKIVADNYWLRRQGRSENPEFSTTFVGTYTYGEWGPTSGQYREDYNS